MNINCSFIVPVNNEKQFKLFEKSLKKFKNYEVIPVREAKSFFDAWEKGLRKVTKKYVVLTHQDTEFISFPDLDKAFDYPRKEVKDENGEWYWKKCTGMVGVAGTTVLHKSQPWWFSQERVQGRILSGEIYHGDELSVFGDYGWVVVLDGVCLVTIPKLLKEMLPTKDYGTWDFYDHILSLDFIKKGYILKTVPIKMRHSSKGGGQKSFNENMIKFRDEYLDKTWRVVE